MVFSSLVFISILLPVTLLFHWLLPSVRAKNIVLLIASLVFYAYGEPVYILLLLASTVANYAFGRLLDSRRSRGILALAVIFNLTVLGIFKYAGFLTELFNQCLQTGLPVPRIRLPIGISFFTFQAMSYVIDVYRGDARCSRNYPRVLLYISLFPQLVAGPIVQYRDIDREIDERHQSAEQMVRGMQRFTVGLAKKVLIANTMGAVVDPLFAAGSPNIALAWLGAISYMLQIYFDFSGYSDMAIGMGMMFGFHFKENFNYPYTALGIRDFWRRWHISLSTWFREYLYIPLGGNRKGSTRTMVNRFIVFLCTGIWHGANLTFLFWGIYHGLLITAEGLLEKRRRAAATAAWKKLFLHLYTLLAVCVGFVFFRADTISQGFGWVKAMFAGWRFPEVDMIYFQRYLTPWYLTMLILGVLFSGPLLRRLPARVQSSGTLRGCCSLGLLVICMLSLAANTYNPFIYFQF